MNWYKRLLLAALSVLFLSVGWLRVSGLPLLVALVPLLLVSGTYDSSRRSFWRMAGWTSIVMAVWTLLTVWWIWYAAPVGTIAAVIIQIVLFGGIFMLYHYTSKRAPAVVSYAILIGGWMAAEFLYLTGEVSFPWLLLGNGMANDPWAVQWYEFTGIFGGTLWVLLANVLIYRAIIFRGRKRIMWAAGVVAVPLISSAIMYAAYSPAAARAKVTVVQPNLDPYVEKFYMSRAAQNQIYLSLAAEAPADVDWIVMPETSIDDGRYNGIWENDMNSHPVIREYADFLKESYPSAQIITGASTYKRYDDPARRSETARPNGGYWYDVYNSALQIDTAGVRGVHHKEKLVIGVEKMPFMKLLKPLEKLIVDLGGTTGMLGYDGAKNVFAKKCDNRGGAIVSAAPICYESVYGESFSEFPAKGAQVIFVITNDGWWKDTPGYKQHFSFARLRAIETRRAVARSANTGISGFIDSRGVVGQTLGWDVRGTLSAEVELSDKLTFYTRYGDYLARLGVLVFGLSVLYYIAYRFRKRSHLEE